MIRTSTLCLLTTLLGAASQAVAGQIYINSPLVIVESTDTVANAKYRLSNNNFDLSIDNSPSTFTPADQVTAGLGNRATLSGRTFDFVLQHVAGEGIIFSATDSGSIGATVSWGTFGTTPGGNNEAALNGILPPTEFNSLLIGARASQVVDAGSSSFEYENLAFSGSGLSIVDGAFTSGTVTPTSGDPLGFSFQRLFADVNLADFDWTLTGTITGTKFGNGGDETVRFNVGFQQVEASVVPEPSTLAMAGLGILAAGGFGVRRRLRRGAGA
jgi:hypothetical protein